MKYINKKRIIIVLAILPGALLIHVMLPIPYRYVVDIIYGLTLGYLWW